MIANFVVFLLAGATQSAYQVSAGAAPDNQTTSIVQIARSGNLVIARIKGKKLHSQTVIDVVAAGCSIAFKTADFYNGFRAQIIDFSHNLKIEAVTPNEVRVIDSLDPSNGWVLHHERSTLSVRDELLGIQQACRTANIIF